MTDQEFDIYLAEGLAELKTKQSYLEAEFGLGRYERFFIDYEKEELQFFRDGKIALSCTFICVGSHVSEKQSWRWSWANPSLPESVRKKAAGVRQLFGLTGFDLFQNPDVSADESMAWEFVALSCKMLGAMGAYSMPQRNLRAYVLIDVIKKEPNQTPEPTAPSGRGSS